MGDLSLPQRDNIDIPCRVIQALPNGLLQEELGQLLPSIAEQMASAVDADACAMYVYSQDFESTLAVFRSGYGDDPTIDVALHDHVSPWTIPVEAAVLGSCRPIRRSSSDDWQRWPTSNDQLIEREQVLSDVVVPLIWHQSTHGVVYVWRRGDSQRFADDEVARLEELARIAAMVISFSYGYSDEHALQDRLNVLLDVASLVDAPSTVDEILPSLARALRESVHADVCNLYVFDDTGDSVQWAYSSGLIESEQWVFSNSMSYPVNSVPVEQRIARSLKPEIVTNFDADLARGSELVAYARKNQISTILVAPVVHDSRMIGCVYLWYRLQDQRFDDDALKTVEAIAASAAGVVARARLHEESQQHVAETESLLRIGQAVLASDELEPVLDEIGETLLSIIPYDYAYLGLINREATHVDVVRDWGDFAGIWQRFAIPVDGSLTGMVVKSGKLLNSLNPRADPRSLKYPTDAQPLGRMMIAPLISESGVIGTLGLGRIERKPYSPRQERMLTLFSQHAALAIDRVRYREQLSRRAQHQTFLASAVDLLVSEHDPERAVQMICQRASGVLADGAAAAVATRESGTLRWIASAFQDSALERAFAEFLQQISSEQQRDLVDRTLTTERAIAVEVGDVTSQHAEIYEQLRKMGVEHMLIVPIRKDRPAAGILCLISTSSAASFDEDTIEASQVIARRIGDALERRALVKDREALLRVAEALTSTISVDDMVDVFAREFRSVIPCEQFYLSTVSGTGLVREAVLLDTPWIVSRQPEQLPRDAGLTGVALNTGRPIFDNNAHLNPLSFYPTEEIRSYLRERGESVMVAPLIAEDRIIGSLMVGRTGTNQFTESDFDTFMLFASLAAASMYRVQLLNDIQLVYRASVEVLAAVVDAKDPTTLRHSRNVGYFAELIARLLELPDEEVERIELAGLLHDIGKIGIPDRVLAKPGPLTPAERTLIQTHPERGAQILAQHPALTRLVPLIRHHHEWFNGNGYPDGLIAGQIPLGASILSVADAFDTMISERTYHQRRSVIEALDELERCAGMQFHPDIVVRFARAIRQNHELVQVAPAKAESV